MRNREAHGRHGHWMRHVAQAWGQRYAHDGSEECGGSRGYRHHGGHRRGARPFDYGELRLLVLGMIAEQPRHGYDLIKAIEERLAGAYSPSPGVIYPALAMLEEMGLIALDAPPEEAGSGRKRYAITEAGLTQLAADRAKLDAILARMSQADSGRRGQSSTVILRGMENVKLALRLRMAQGLTPQQERVVADALDAAARAIEQV